MIDSKKVFELADRWVQLHHPFSADPSTDVMMVALVEALAAKLNAELSTFMLGVLTIFTYKDDPEAFNYAVAQLAGALGIQPPAVPPTSGSPPQNAA